MNIGQPLIPVIYARVISRAAGRDASEVKAVLRGTGIDDSSDGRQSLGMNGEQYRRLLKNAFEVSGDPAIALRAGMNLPITTHGDLGIASITAPTLRASLEVFANFVKVRNPHGGLSMRDRGDYLELIVEMDDTLQDQRDMAIDLVCAAFTSGSMKSLRSVVSNITLKMDRQKPDNSQLYVSLLSCPIEWDSDVTAFVIPKRDLDKTLPDSNPEAFSAALERLQKLYFLLQKTGSCKDSVVAVFTQQAGRICTMTTVTDALHFSPRTLNRRLKQEGTSFQEVLDDWLKQQALNYLQQGGLTIEATAALMGYGDEANFRRAFKRWFGKPVTSYLSGL
ncbi:MAG: ornithine utilization transcriptional regulator OruR [Candidatus Pelagadaptatus aseana]|uniref:AraC family transcriptional regulator n=1 Tax=Candidatus Pelagadaptatus aseana TaxID=3120508 RepID=UPI0039B1C8C3